MSGWSASAMKARLSDHSGERGRGGLSGLKGSESCAGERGCRERDLQDGAVGTSHSLSVLLALPKALVAGATGHSSSQSGAAMTLGSGQAATYADRPGTRKFPSCVAVVEFEC